MIASLLYFVTNTVLRLRYRVTLSGLDTLTKKSDKGFLFLPNHPALIDPVLMQSILFKKFKPHALADESQIDIPIVGNIIKEFNLIPIPDIKKSGISVRDSVIESMNRVNTCLKEGENVLLYPSGQLYRSTHEDLSGKSSLSRILAEVPDVNIVLVKTDGLWGSSFSWAGGHPPGLFTYWKRNLLAIICNLGFFMPKRSVSITFEQPDDIPLDKGRTAIYAYLSKFYNKRIVPNTYKPYFWWQGYHAVVKPEPKNSVQSTDLDNIPDTIKNAIIDKVKDMTGRSKVTINHSLNKDLGIDSLGMVELVTWLESEYTTSISSIESLQSVGSLVLAATGVSLDSTAINRNLIHKQWFETMPTGRIEPLAGSTILELFLAQAKRNPKKVIIADQTSGNRTYNDILVSMMVLKPFIEAIPEKQVAIMLPASVTATVLYFAVLAAGKVPIMINWTSGEVNIQHGLLNTDTRTIITAKKLLDKIKTQGFKQEQLSCEWFILEDLISKVGIVQKISALINARFNLKSFFTPTENDTAVVLFTSGSESKPKAVPLTHANLIANYRDYTKIIDLRKDDSLLSMLPPFHSFGIAIGVVLPLVTNMKTVYHANPTEGALLATIIQAYKPTVLFGTPTFLNGILRSTTDEGLKTTRLAVVGAEKCPDYVYEKFSELCPKAVIIEGYGITECSPVVSANKVEASVPGSIGYVMPSLTYHIIHHETHVEVAPGQEGLLIVKGTSIFNGYLNFDGVSPFIEYKGEIYYNTGDLVSEGSDGLLTFKGRLKRFIKLAGEMVSLPAIEAALQQHYPGTDEGPAIAIDVIGPDEYQEIVLLTTEDLAREYINDLLRSEGLPTLYNIKKVLVVEFIPVLGTGKTDYQTIKGLLLEAYP
ncbi:MAG: AMP-binding protein [Fibrobacterales bacterium]